MNLINYIWVGKPTEFEPQTISGHDIAGPIKMAKHLAAQGSDVKLKFWCLREHADYYRERFTTSGVDIHVDTIEDLLDRENNRIVSQKYQEILDKCTQDTTQRVTFKDSFSFFLLLTQGGLVCDTNVFPVETIIIDLSKLGDEVITAKTPDADRNDFYWMYSPKPNHKRVDEIIHQWSKIKDPEISPWYAFTGSKIDKLTHWEIIEHGFNKRSFKSYFKSAPKGLAYWYSEPDFKNYLSYGDVNQLFSSEELDFFSPLENINLYTHEKKADESVEDLIKLDFPDDSAFVAWGEEIYFVDKKTPYIGRIEENKIAGMITFFPIEMEQNKQVAVTDLYRLQQMRQWLVHPEARVKHITCISSATLLHKAVLDQDLEKINALLDAGANPDLAASFKIYDPHATPQETIKRLSPRNLALELGRDELFTARDRDIFLKDLARRPNFFSPVREKTETAKEDSTYHLLRSKK